MNLFPHLAKFVKNLLIRVPPDNATPTIDDLEETRTYLRVTGITEAKSLTNAEEDIYHRTMVAPLALWKTLAEDDMAIQDRVRLSFPLFGQDAKTLIIRYAGHRSSLLADFSAST